jgi:hypothetical protein
VLITGTNFPTSQANAAVKFGSQSAFITNFAPGQITVTAPAGTITTNPACVNGNPSGTLQIVSTVDVTVTDLSDNCVATAAQAFSFELPCIAPTPTPGP